MTLEPEALERKPGAGAGADWEKNQEPKPLEKKSGAGAGAAKKLAGSPPLASRIWICFLTDSGVNHQPHPDQQ